MADGDITDPSLVEARPSRDHLRVSTVFINFDDKTMKVGFTERDNGGASIGKRREGGLIIRNIVDDPETPEDESTTDYTATIETGIKAMVSNVVGLLDTD